VGLQVNQDLTALTLTNLTSLSSSSAASYVIYTQNAGFKIFFLLGRIISLKNSCGFFFVFNFLPILMMVKHTELNEHSELRLSIYSPSAYKFEVTIL